jgi:predicted signal transduction protein with EAL and GGDEF domain
MRMNLLPDLGEMNLELFSLEPWIKTVFLRGQQNSTILGKFWKQENHQYFISFSIGSATYPGDGSSSYEMYKNANIAMNKGKKSGKNTLVFFEDVELKNVTENVELANDLQKALESGELFLHYQPVYNLKTMEVEGLEALIRWKNYKRGFVPPDSFIPVAEETGQILNIDRWVLTKCWI